MLIIDKNTPITSTQLDYETQTMQDAQNMDIIGTMYILHINNYS